MTKLLIATFAGILNCPAALFADQLKRKMTRSAFGTKRRTSSCHPAMSAIGGKADISCDGDNNY